MLDQIEAFLRRWLPAFEADQRSYLTVAIGCTGGQHRSVWFAERLARAFASGAPALVRHRELDAALASSRLAEVDGVAEQAALPAAHRPLPRRSARAEDLRGALPRPDRRAACASGGRSASSPCAPGAKRAAPRARPCSSYEVGTLAELIDVDSAQAGILLVRCRGRQRFAVGATRQAERRPLARARPTPIDDDPVVAPAARHAEHRAQGLADAIASLAAQGAQPFLAPHRLDDAGWVANRWCEILPLPLEAKHRLMTLERSDRSPRRRRFADAAFARRRDGPRSAASRLRSGAGRPNASAAVVASASGPSARRRAAARSRRPRSSSGNVQRTGCRCQSKCVSTWTNGSQPSRLRPARRGQRVEAPPTNRARASSRARPRRRSRRARPATPLAPAQLEPHVARAGRARMRRVLIG